MRIKSSIDGIPLSSFEFAFLCCVVEAEDGATVGELVEYMMGMAGLIVSVASMGQVARRMEQLAYIYSTDRDDSAVPTRFGRMIVKTWRILNPGRDALAAHIAWVKRTARAVETETP
jgi:hypothetical protein